MYCCINNVRLEAKYYKYIQYGICHIFCTFTLVENKIDKCIVVMSKCLLLNSTAHGVEVNARARIFKLKDSLTPLFASIKL